MRKMVDGKTTLKIVNHFILSNFWEYFLEKADKNGVAFGVVMGFETEMGDVDINEIKPHIISSASTSELHDILPAKGWKWCDCPGFACPAHGLKNGSSSGGW